MNSLGLSKDPKLTANLQGYGAILLWSSSALFIAWTAGIPPFLLAALSSFTGLLIFALGWARDPEKLKNISKQTWPIWVLFFVAVVVYRGFYLSGLKLAPIVEANLLNYLWPLLIVIFSAVLERQKLSLQVLLGAALCFLGVICIGIGQHGGGFRLEFQLGHILAIGAALSWSGYSVLTKKFQAAPTDMIGVMHGVAAVFFVFMHMAFEPSFDWRQADMAHYAGILGLGVAVSYGYSMWDKAMTGGDRNKVAVAAYMTPLLSTLWLILFSGSPMTIWVWYAVAFIIGGTFTARSGQIADSLRALRRV